MARLNIEDSLFKDERFYNLVSKVGGLPMALGVLVQAWIVAQEFWKNSSNGIPLTVWEKKKLSNEIIGSELAIKQGEFIYIKGSKRHFAWLAERRSAGRNGGLKRAANAKSLKNSSSKTKQTQPSSSSSYSYSISSSHSKEEDSRFSKRHPLVDLWNEQGSKEFPKVENISNKRLLLLNRRWKENPSQEYWIKVIEKLNQSEFCRGNNQRGWVANLDFFIKPDTHVKILEGQYQSNKQEKKSALQEWFAEQKKKETNES